MRWKVATLLLKWRPLSLVPIMWRLRIRILLEVWLNRIRRKWMLPVGRHSLWFAGDLTPGSRYPQATGVQA